MQVNKSYPLWKSSVVASSKVKDFVDLYKNNAIKEGLVFSPMFPLDMKSSNVEDEKLKLLWKGIKGYFLCNPFENFPPTTFLSRYYDCVVKWDLLHFSLCLRFLRNCENLGENWPKRVERV